MNISTILPIIEKAAKNNGLILVEAELVKETGKLTLKIFIYNPEKPVTHEDCQNISRMVDEYLDEIITEPYNLEVSSPGLDRKLKSEKEYHIFKGKRAKIKLKNGEVFISEINDEIMEKYRKGEISYVKLEPEYKF